MGRTLYLTENDKFRAVADGPSIWIDWENKAGRRIPLRLISRCIIVGNILVESNLISILAVNNIPIVLTDLSGHELATILPYNHRLPKHFREQRIFLETKKNRERFINWAKVKRMTLQIKLIKKIFPKKAGRFAMGIGEEDYQFLISSFKQRSYAKWDIIKGFIVNLFRSLIIEHLIRSNLNLDLGIIHRYHNFGLVLDFCYILEPQIDEQCIQFFKVLNNLSFFERKEREWRVNKDGIKGIIQRFENKKEENANIIANTLDEFFQLMRELRL